MGNALGCISTDEEQPKKISKFRLHPLPISASFNGGTTGLLTFSSYSRKKKNNNNNYNNKKLMKKERVESLEIDVESSLHAQALAAALVIHQTNGTLPRSRSTSVTYPSPGSKKQQRFPRSWSSRPRSQSDPLLQPQQLVNQDLKIECQETNRFILVHGGGFGAWCWYKTMTLLEESGFKVDAVDLTGSGVSSYDTNSITSLEQYVKPLTALLGRIGESEKVILVGHDFGGACISYVMELFPSKIAKAVFIAAAMLTSGQSALDMFSQQIGSNKLMQEAQIFLYANGKDNPPTAIDLNRPLLRDLLFNQTSAKDIALASVSMRPIPFAPVLEKLCLSEMNYGSIPRFYIKTQEDCAIPGPLQESMINSDPPQQVFLLKGCDHAPFFSKPQALHKILVEISQIPQKQA